MFPLDSSACHANCHQTPYMHIHIYTYMPSISLSSLLSLHFESITIPQHVANAWNHLPQPHLLPGKAILCRPDDVVTPLPEVAQVNLTNLLGSESSYGIYAPWPFFRWFFSPTQVLQVVGWQKPGKPNGFRPQTLGVDNKRTADNVVENLGKRGKHTKADIT